jgi:hypothetical protein
VPSFRTTEGGAVVDKVMRPDLPAVDFDWDPETWEKAARRAVELAVDVSTGWEKRRPGPEETPDQILKRFREPLPRSPAPFEAIVDRVLAGGARGRARRSARRAPGRGDRGVGAAGVAIVSNARLRDGRTALRACIVNFRTGPGDVEAVVRASAAIGRELARR